MPLMRVLTTNLAANSTAFPFQGQQYEIMQWPAHVEFAVVANAITVDVTIYSGSDLLQQGGPPILKTTVTTVYPDDFLLEDDVAASDRLNVILRETGGVATTDIESTARLTPLAIG